jgi:uncharacterized membrane-anchored protein YhcB (DUF1043 family)
MIIAAAAFGSTIAYNIIQMRKAQQKMQDEIKNNQDQLENQRKISEAGFWLTLRDQLSLYDDMKSSFDLGGKWYAFGIG